MWLPSLTVSMSLHHGPVWGSLDRGITLGNVTGPALFSVFRHCGTASWLVRTLPCLAITLGSQLPFPQGTAPLLLLPDTGYGDTMKAHASKSQIMLSILLTLQDVVNRSF